MELRDRVESKIFLNGGAKRKFHFPLYAEGAKKV